MYRYKKELPDVFFDDWVTIKNYVTKQIQQQNHLDYAYVLAQNENLNDPAVPDDSSESSESEDSKILKSLCSLENFQTPLLLTTIDKVVPSLQMESTFAVYAEKEMPNHKNDELLSKVKSKNIVKGQKNFIGGKSSENLVGIDREENSITSPVLITRSLATLFSDPNNLSLNPLSTNDKTANKLIDSKVNDYLSNNIKPNAELGEDTQISYNREDIDLDQQEIINEKFEEELRQEYLKRIEKPQLELVETVKEPTMQLHYENILPYDNILKVDTFNKNTPNNFSNNFLKPNSNTCFENFYIVIKVIFSNVFLASKLSKICMYSILLFTVPFLNLKAFVYSIYLSYWFNNFYRGVYSIHKVAKHNWDKYTLTKRLVSLTKSFTDDQILKGLGGSDFKKVKEKKENVSVEFLKEDMHNYYNKYYHTEQGVLRCVYKKFQIPIKYKKIDISFYFFLYLQSLQKIFENVVYSYRIRFNKEYVLLTPNHQQRTIFISLKKITTTPNILVNLNVTAIPSLPVVTKGMIKSENWSKCIKIFFRQSIKIGLKNIFNPTLFKVNYIYNITLTYQFLTNFSSKINKILEDVKINQLNVYLCIYRSANPLLNVTFDTFRLTHEINRSVVEWVGTKNISLFILFCEYILTKKLTTELLNECCFEDIFVDNIKTVKINVQFIKQVLNARTVIITWKKNSFPPFYIFKFKKFLTTNIIVKHSSLTIVDTKKNLISLVAKQIAKFIHHKNLKPLTYFDWNMRHSIEVLTSNLFFYLKNNYIARMTYFLLLIGYEFHLESIAISLYSKRTITDPVVNSKLTCKQVNITKLTDLIKQLVPNDQAKNLIKPLPSTLSPKPDHWQYEWLLFKKNRFFYKQLMQLKKLESFNLKSDKLYYQKSKKIQNVVLLKSNIKFLFAERYDALFLNDTGIIQNYYFNEIYADEIKNIVKLFKYTKYFKNFKEVNQLYALSALKINQIKFYSKLFYNKIQKKVKKKKVKTNVIFSKRLQNKYNILETVVYLQKKNQKTNIIYTIPMLKNVIIQLHTNKYKLLNKADFNGLKQNTNKSEWKVMEDFRLNTSKSKVDIVKKTNTEIDLSINKSADILKIVKTIADFDKNTVFKQPYNYLNETNTKKIININETYLANLEDIVFDWVNRKVTDTSLNSKQISYQKLKEKKIILKQKMDNYRLWRFYLKKNWIEKIKMLSTREVNWFLFKTINLTTNHDFQLFLNLKKTYSEWQKLIPLINQKPEYFRFILRAGFWKFMPRIPLSTHFFYKILNINIKKKFYKTDILINLKMLFFELNLQKYNLTPKTTNDLTGPTKPWVYYDTSRRKKIKHLKNNLVCSYGEKCVCLPSLVCLQSLTNLTKIHYKTQKKIFKITNYEIHTLQLVDLTPKLYLENLACTVFRHVVVINMLEISSKLLFDLISFFFKYRVWYRDIYFYIETPKFSFIWQYKRVLIRKQGVWNKKTSNFILNGVSNFLHFNCKHDIPKIQKKDILVFNCHLHIPGVSGVYKAMSWPLKSSILYKAKIKPSSIYTYNHIKNRMILKKNKKIF